MGISLHTDVLVLAMKDVPLTLTLFFSPLLPGNPVVGPSAITSKSQVNMPDGSKADCVEPRALETDEIPRIVQVREGGSVTGRGFQARLHTQPETQRQQRHMEK